MFENDDAQGGNNAPPADVGEEMLPIWSPAGFDSGGLAAKGTVHRQGLWHPTAQIWLSRPITGDVHRVNGTSELLLQLRSDEKDNFPSCWDVSVAGHVSAGETVEQGALRELGEELGLQLEPQDLRFLFRMPYYGHYENGLIDCEWQYVYLAELAPDFDELALRLQESEVSSLRWFCWADLCSEWADFAVQHGKGFCKQWQGYEVRGFALHRHYPDESNSVEQRAPKVELAENYYWAKMLQALQGIRP